MPLRDRVDSWLSIRRDSEGTEWTLRGPRDEFSTRITDPKSPGSCMDICVNYQDFRNEQAQGDSSNTMSQPAANELVVDGRTITTLTPRPHFVRDLPPHTGKWQTSWSGKRADIDSSLDLLLTSRNRVPDRPVLCKVFLTRDGHLVSSDSRRLSLIRCISFDGMPMRGMMISGDGLQTFRSAVTSVHGKGKKTQTGMGVTFDILAEKHPGDPHTLRARCGNIEMVAADTTDSVGMFPPFQHLGLPPDRVMLTLPQFGEWSTAEVVTKMKQIIKTTPTGGQPLAVLKRNDDGVYRLSGLHCGGEPITGGDQIGPKSSHQEVVVDAGYLADAARFAGEGKMTILPTKDGPPQHSGCRIVVAVNSKHVKDHTPDDVPRLHMLATVKLSSLKG